MRAADGLRAAAKSNLAVHRRRQVPGQAATVRYPGWHMPAARDRGHLALLLSSHGIPAQATKYRRTTYPSLVGQTSRPRFFGGSVSRPSPGGQPQRVAAGFALGDFCQ
jgi:hypothetical protein